MFHELLTLIPEPGVIDKSQIDNSFFVQGIFLETLGL